MTYIGGTTYTRLTSTQQPIQAEQSRVMSNRYAEASTQTTSSETASLGSAASAPATYANPAQTATRGHPSLSSKASSDAPADNSAPKPRADLESLRVIKGLMARYENAGGVDAADRRPKVGELFDLTLTTKQGDTVTISVSAESLLGEKYAPGDSEFEMNFSFSVSGELSDTEREAVDELVARLGDIASVYQESGWADVEFLDAFDSDVLMGLDLDVAGENDNALTISYNLDMVAGVQSLAVNQNNYEYELSADIYLDANALALQENELYLQYQQALVDSTRSYKAGEFSGGVGAPKAAEFFLDGLEAILSPLEVDKEVASTDGSSDSNLREDGGVVSGSQLTTGAADPSPNDATADLPKQPKQGATAEAFLSGLPDFSASFNTPRFTPNASNLGEVSQMTMSMEQVTDSSLSYSSGVRTLQQTYSYQSQVSQHFGVGGDSVKHANLGDVNEPGGQSYVYQVVNQSAVLARTLEVDAEGAVIGYEESKDSEHLETTKQVVEGEITSMKKDDLTDPWQNYAFALQAADSPVKAKLHALQLGGYRDIQMLEQAVSSQRINLYS